MTTLVKVDPVWTAESQQTIFRALLTALSFPGRVQDITSPLAGARAAVGVLSALIDERVTVADPKDLLSVGERRLLAPGAFVAVSEAAYILMDGNDAPPDDFAPNIGTIYRPEAGALLLLTCENLTPAPSPSGVGKSNPTPCPSPSEGEGLGRGIDVTLTGPGVETEQSFVVIGLHPDWLSARNRWCSNFPTGCDLILCADTQIVGIPRTSTLTFTEEER